MHESEKWKWSSSVVSDSGVWLFATPWTAAYQSPPSMGFTRHEYWSGVPSGRGYQITLFEWMVPRKNLSRCFGTTYRKGRDKPNMHSLPWSSRKSSSWLQEANLRLACCHCSPGRACQRNTSSVMLDSWGPYLGTSWLHSHSNLWWISSTHSGKSHRNMLVTQSCLTPCDPMDCSLPSSLESSGSLWNPPGKNTGVDCHAFLQGIFPIQGSNLVLLRCRQILYHLCH